MANHVLRAWGIGQLTEVGTEQSLSLRGRPHPLMKLMEDDAVFSQRLNDLYGLQSPLPLEAGLLVEEKVNYLASRNTLEMWNREMV